MYARPGAYVSAAANWLIALHPSLFAHDFKRIADAAISQQLASWCFVTHSRALIKHPRTHILLPRSSRSAYRPPTRPDRAVGSIVPRAALGRSPVWRRLAPLALLKPPSDTARIESLRCFGPLSICYSWPKFVRFVVSFFFFPSLKCPRNHSRAHKTFS